MRAIYKPLKPCSLYTYFLSDLQVTDFSNVPLRAAGKKGKKKKKKSYKFRNLGKWSIWRRGGGVQQRAHGVGTSKSTRSDGHRTRIGFGNIPIYTVRNMTGCGMYDVVSRYHPDLEYNRGLVLTPESQWP